MNQKAFAIAKLGCQPAPAMIKSVENVLALTAMVASIRPTVEAYEQEILARHQFHIAKKWRDQGCEDILILDRKLTYLLDQETDFVTFDRERIEACAASGLKVENPSFCPLLVAEHLLVQAENQMFDAVCGLPLFAFLAKPWLLTLDDRRNVIEVIERVFAPFVGNASEILARLAA
jgi:hypothetical protein